MRIHHAPPFPALSLSGNMDALRLEKFGKSLCSHCDYISDGNKSLPHGKESFSPVCALS